MIKVYDQPKSLNRNYIGYENNSLIDPSIGMSPCKGDVQFMRYENGVYNLNQCLR